MLEPIAIPDADILDRLHSRFGIEADAVEFLPLGYDADAWVYRVRASDGDRFLKIRRGPVNEAGLAVPRFLSSHGVRHLVTPIPTVTGELYDAGELAFVLFPFVEGRSGGHGMTSTQWAELGATMRTVHELPVDQELGSRLRTEDFVPARIAKLRAVETAVLASDPAGDPHRLALADIWRVNRERIDGVVARTEALALLVRDRGDRMVLCHADSHAWNVIVTPEGDLALVDWDGAMLAPRERDLMFVDGEAGGHEADPVAFFSGYGEIGLDHEVMAFYRVEWTVQDLAEFGATVVLDAEAGDATKDGAIEAIEAILARC